MTVSKTFRLDFDFDAIEYPAFVVVYGRSKSGITTYNRSEYDEQFACDLCRDPLQARALTEGYPGHHSDMRVYAIPKPSLVLQVQAKGTSTEYDKSWDGPSDDSDDE